MLGLGIIVDSAKFVGVRFSSYDEISRSIVFGKGGAVHASRQA